MRKLNGRAIAVVGLLASNPSWGYTINGFAASTTYNPNTAQMDAALGITGYVIEDFEDATLVPGLSVEYTHTGLGQMTSLPTICTDNCGAPADPPYFRRSFASHAWDGTFYLYALQPATPDSALILRLEGGATSVGVGLSDYHPLTQLWAINGQLVGDMTTVPNIEANDGGRNAYLRVDAGPGEGLIYSLTFYHHIADTLEYDHVAFSPAPVPTPSAWLCLAAGLGALGVWGRFGRQLKH